MDPTWLHNHRDFLGSYKEASNDFSDPAEASKSMIVCCFPAMRLLSWNSAHRGRWHGKKIPTDPLFCSRLNQIAIRYCFNQIPKSCDKDDVLGGWWGGGGVSRQHRMTWCLVWLQWLDFPAQEFEFPSGGKEFYFFFFAGVGIWDSETPKDIL